MRSPVDIIPLCTKYAPTIILKVMPALKIILWIVFEIPKLLEQSLRTYNNFQELADTAKSHRFICKKMKYDKMLLKIIHER
jgi:hypothetical protein